jgi:serine/threonine-protein kinase PRP4
MTVAVKMIRNNDIMKKAADKELSILTDLASKDPENKKHCVRILANLEYRNHVALVFESMHMNLRETIKKFGKNVGINATAVRMYARQLLIALKHLADLRVVHADIKPDNILVSEDLKQVNNRI